MLTPGWETYVGEFYGASFLDWPLFGREFDD